MVFSLRLHRSSSQPATALLRGGAVLLASLILSASEASALEAPAGPQAAAPSLPAAPATPTAPSTSLASTRQIVLELSKRTISLLEGDKVLGRWPVAIGDPSTPTPVGSFSVINKVVNPQYQSTRSGRNNPNIGANGPLGDRWIGFLTSGRNQFGIHGTPRAWEWTVTSRSAVSHGCVRMLTPHVRYLFERVEVGTPVIVKR